MLGNCGLVGKYGRGQENPDVYRETLALTHVCFLEVWVNFFSLSHVPDLLQCIYIFVYFGILMCHSRVINTVIRL